MSPLSITVVVATPCERVISVPVTETVNALAMSADVATYVLAVAPVMLRPARFHWYQRDGR